MEGNKGVGGQSKDEHAPLHGMGLRRSDAGLKAEFFSFLSVHLSAPLLATPLRLPTATSTETSSVLSALSLFTKLMLGHFPERNNWVCSLRSKETTSLRSRSPRIFLRNHHECDPAPTLLRCWLTVSSRKWPSINERSALAHHKKQVIIACAGSGSWDQGFLKVLWKHMLPKPYNTQELLLLLYFTVFTGDMNRAGKKLAKVRAGKREAGFELQKSDYKKWL